MTATIDSTTVPKPAQTLDPAAIAARCRTIIDEVSSRLLERNNPVRVLWTTMLAGQHAILLGPPGAAKSELIRDMTAPIEGGQYFEIQVHKHTEPKDIFGPINLGKAVQGEYEQQLDGHATQAHVVFVDEVFKAGGTTLNALLSFFNERTYRPDDGRGQIDCPLIAAIAASNELPAGDDCAAFYDRLLVRLEVGYLKHHRNFRQLITGRVRAPRPAVPRPAVRPASPRTTLGLADLQAAVYEYVPAVTISEAIADALWKLRENLNAVGIVVSDRRWVQGTRLMQASAFLDGRVQVDLKDLAILKHVLWHTPDRQQEVARLVAQAIDPHAKDIFAISDRIETLAADYDALKDNGTDMTARGRWAVDNTSQFNQVKEHLERLKTTAAQSGGPSELLKDTYARFVDVHGSIVEDTMGFNPYAGVA